MDNENEIQFTQSILSLIITEIIGEIITDKRNKYLVAFLKYFFLIANNPNLFLLIVFDKNDK